MEPLDLRRHSPDEIVGKSLTIGARNYTIGAKFEDGADAHACFLFNESSYEILKAAMAECPDQRLITPQVRQLADLYSQAAGTADGR